MTGGGGLSFAVEGFSALCSVFRLGFGEVAIGFAFIRASPVFVGCLVGSFM